MSIVIPKELYDKIIKLLEFYYKYIRDEEAGKIIEELKNCKPYEADS